MSTAATHSRTKILNITLVKKIEKTSSTNEEQALIDDAKQSPREKKLARTINHEKAVIARKENPPIPADQDKNLAPHKKIDKGGAVKSAPDVNGKEKETQKQSLDALKTWAESYTSTSNCSPKTKKTIKSIVQTVEQALKNGQTAVDLASHADKFSELRSIRRKALRSALKEFTVTGLPVAQKKTASPPLSVAKNASNIELEKTAATPAETTLQLDWGGLTDTFETMAGECFDKILDPNDVSNLEGEFAAFARAFLNLMKTGEMPTSDTLNDTSTGVEAVMISMFNHVHSRVTSRIQDNTASPEYMNSLLIKLQGDKGIRSIWTEFVNTWNGALPDGATKMIADLVQLKRLESTVIKHAPVEKASKAAPPYNQETAWAAYNEAYKRYRIPHIHQKLMAFAGNDLGPYAQSFKILTAKGSGLSADTAQQMVLQRSLVDFVGSGRTKTDAETNTAVMGCGRSYFDDNPKQSAQEVAFTMITPMLVGENIKNVTILTLAAPPLDDKNHPIWNNFVDEKGKLNEEVYSKHYRSLCSLIKQASDQNPDKRVVMSAVGMGAFVSALSPDQQEVARDIAANHLAQLAKALSDEGRRVAYSDISVSSQNAMKIQKSVIKNGMAPLHFVGKLPGDWMSDGDLYINAGDPHSCAGNGGALDDSLEGKLGRFSLMSDIHVQVAINARLAKTAQQ